MQETWGSICHGAGRVQSRTAAKAAHTSRQVIEKLRARGVEIHARGKKTIVEEAPEAYKDVSLVVETCEKAGIARKVARLRPMIVIKG
jgi:tRNA-splicing ligase RtcB